MHVAGIRDDIAHGRSSGLRSAFAALAVPTWDRIVYVFGEPVGNGERAELLSAVCEALIEDDGIMPSELCDELGLPEGSTYADGVLMETVVHVARERQTEWQEEADG